MTTILAHHATKRELAEPVSLLGRLGERERFHGQPNRRGVSRFWHPRRRLTPAVRLSLPALLKAAHASGRAS